MSSSQTNFTTDLIPSYQQINKIPKRFLSLSPTVDLGLERECTKHDFYNTDAKSIGKGGFGEVWKVIHRSTKRIFCIKILSKKDIIDEKLIPQLNKELQIMYSINHQHSIKLYNHFEDADKFYLVMELATKGSLYSRMISTGKFSEADAAQFTRETCSIIKYLHSRNIVHCDIKPENLWLDDNERIKLCDYGWANYFSSNSNEQLRNYCGTLEYWSPEMIRKCGYNEKIDIWSVGVLLFEMLAGYAPFTSRTKEEIFKNIWKIKINFPADFPPLAKDLVTKILKYDPRDRLEIDEILEHEWFKVTPPTKEELFEKPLSAKEILISRILNCDNCEDSPAEKYQSTLSEDNCFDETKDNSAIALSPQGNKSWLKIRTSLSCNNNGNGNLEIKTLKIENIELDSQLFKIKEKLSFLENVKEENTKWKDEIIEWKRNIAWLEVKNKERDYLVLENENKDNWIQNWIKEKEEFEINKIWIQKWNSEISQMRNLLNEKDKIIQSLTVNPSNTEPNINELIYSELINLSNAINIFFTSSEKASSISEILKIISSTQIESLRQITTSQSSMKTKSLEHLDWVQTKLWEYQNKSNTTFDLEEQLTQVKNELHLVKAQIHSLNQEIEACNSNIKTKTNIIEEKKNYIFNWETQLSNIKNFVFLNCKLSDDMLKTFGELFD